MSASSYRFGAAVVALAFAAAPALAETVEPSDARPAAEAAPTAATPSAFAGTMTGDWGGLRDRLKDDGLTLTANEITETAWDAIADRPQMARTSGQLMLGATLDADKAFGLKGGKFQLTISNRHGNALTNDAPLNLIQQVQPVYGRGQIWRLSALWYEQAFTGGSFKIGRMNSAEDFASATCDYQNLTLCGSAPGHMAFDQIYNFPVSQWGARLKLNVAANKSVSVGVYESNPDNLRLSQGFNLGFDVEDGVLMMAETAWSPVLGDGLKGTYKIGGWYDTAEVADVATDVNGDYKAVSGLPGKTRDGRYGFWANAVQQVRAPDADGRNGLKASMLFVVTDPRTAQFQGKAALNLAWSGPFAARPQDEIGVGVGVSGYNPRVTDAQQAQVEIGLRDLPAASREYVAEAYYGWKATPWLTVRPNVQLIRHPGGFRDRPTMVVGGLKTVWTF